MFDLIFSVSCSDNRIDRVYNLTAIASDVAGNTAAATKAALSRTIGRVIFGPVGGSAIRKEVISAGASVNLMRCLIGEVAAGAGCPGGCVSRRRRGEPFSKPASRDVTEDRGDSRAGHYGHFD